MQGGLKLEIRISNSNTWKRHSQHLIGLFVFTRSNHLIIGGKMLHCTALQDQDQDSNDRRRPNIV